MRQHEGTRTQEPLQHQGVLTAASTHEVSGQTPVAAAAYLELWMLGEQGLHGRGG